MDIQQALELLENDAYAQGVLLHEVFACMFFLPYMWYLYVLFTYKTYLQMNRKIYFVMPITIFLLGVAIITGIFLLAMRNFIVDIRIFCMIIALCFFLMGEIYRMIRLKKAKTSLENMQSYVKFCKIMYIFFLVVYLCVVGFCKAYKG